jgi:sulfite reductase alpha subunit
MFVKTFSVYSSSPTSTAGPTGNTAASWVFSVTAAASSAVTATSRKCSRGGPFSHHARQPAGGKFYTTEYLKKICDLWEFRGSGITNMHGSTGDIIFLGTTTPQLEEIFYELTHNFNQDLGGSGSNLRTPSDCIGQARCEYACYDTQAICYHLTHEYQDELHRPAFPYKFKFKFDGCPNCCVASIARADMSFIGTWKDDIKIDQEAVPATSAVKSPPTAAPTAGRDWGAFDIEKKSSTSAPPSACGWKAAS